MMSQKNIAAMVCFSTLNCALGRQELINSELSMSAEASLEMAWENELDMVGKGNPQKRVVKLLKKMRNQLQAEADKESEMYEKMVCWCESNTKEKTKAVADAESKDKELSVEIETRAARFGELKTEIAQSKKDIAANTEALKKATAIREAEALKFKAEENDMVQAVTNLQNAIAVLAKHQKSSLLQFGGAVMSGMRVLLRDVALKYEIMMAEKSENGDGHLALISTHIQTGSASNDGVEGALLSALNVHGKKVSDVLPLTFAERVVSDNARDHTGKFLQVGQPTFAKYTSQSGGIYGILTQMLEDFQSQLSTSQKEELQAQEDYKALAAAKSSEIESGKKKLDDMEVEASGNQKALSDAKEDLGLTREQRSADVKFLQNLKLTCNDLDHQWEKRSQTRSAETQAVSEAITILTEDDNREHLEKTLSFLQRSEVDASTARRGNAASFLRRKAASPAFEGDDLLAAWHQLSDASVSVAKGPRTQLSTLAMAVQLDSFTKVKEMMDKMVADLKKQQQEEATTKAHCADEFNTNEKMTYQKSELKKDLNDKVDELTSLITQLGEEIEAAKAAIKEAQLQIKKAGEQRENENGEFQTTVADQRATQEILQKALTKLKDFYEKKIGQTVLLQRVEQEPPVKFNSYKTNAGASPVIGLIEQIMEDSKALEDEAVASETKAQKEYEGFVKDSNGMISTLQESITSKGKTIALSKEDLARASSDLEDTKAELESLTAYEADLHKQCDFLLKNFDIRQQARNDEIEAIQSAKAILSGSSEK